MKVLYNTTHRFGDFLPPVPQEDSYNCWVLPSIRKKEAGVSGLKFDEYVA